MWKKGCLYSILIFITILILLPVCIPDVETITLNNSFRRLHKGAWIKLPQGHTWYELHGTADRPVAVFIHGFTIPSVIWHYTMRPIQQAGFTTLRFDNFGRGFSDRPEVEYNAALYIRQINNLLKRLQINKPVVLIGHSQGAAIAAAFAVQYPRKVSRMILIAPVGTEIGTTLPQEILQLPLIGDYLARLFLDNAIESTFTSHFTDPEVRKVIHPRYRLQRRIRGFRRAFLSGIRQETLEGMAPVFTEAGKLPIPTLIPWGTKDSLAPYISRSSVLKHFPNAVFHPVPGAGHNTHIDGIETVNPLIIQFLKTGKMQSLRIGNKKTVTGRNHR